MLVGSAPVAFIKAVAVAFVGAGTVVVVPVGAAEVTFSAVVVLCGKPLSSAVVMAWACVTCSWIMIMDVARTRKCALISIRQVLV